MSKLQRLKVKLYLFFKADLPLFFEGRSLFTKISLGCLGVVVAQLMMAALFMGAVLAFAWVMSFLSGNKTYPIMHPAEEIATISIVEFSEEVSRRQDGWDQVPAILLRNTTATTPVPDDRIQECVQALLDLPASRWWNDPSQYMDQVALLITYRNGSMEWISADGTYQYDPVGKNPGWSMYHFSREGFLQFLRQFGYEEAP